MALAHLGRLADAHRFLLAGAQQCPRQKRFPEELAGVAFEQKRNPEAARFLLRALALDPHDAYADNFLGTVYDLSGNLPAALKYWNRIDKPYIASLDLDPHLRVHRLLLDRAFVFSPAAVLRAPQFAATQVRLRGLDLFPAYTLHLDALPSGSFNAVFRAEERDGFGPSRLAALLSAFSGAPYETLYPAYANLHRDAMNLDSLLRWDAQKRRLWVSLAAPSREMPQYRWQISSDLRNENWAIRRSFTGTAPVLAALNLEREAASASFTDFHSGWLTASFGAGLVHRTFRGVVPGAALTPSLLTPGFDIDQTATLDARLLSVPEHRITLNAGAASTFARTFSSPSHLFETLQGSAHAHWLPHFTGDADDLSFRFRAARIFGTPPFDQLFLFGMDRDDTDLNLHAHIATRDGRKGSAPIGNAYVLANFDEAHCLWTNGLITLAAGPLLDIGRMTAPTTGLSAGQALVDAGLEARLTVLHTTLVLSYGRDLRTGTNAFWATAAPPLAP